jgi:hypothetical protein
MEVRKVMRQNDIYLPGRSAATYDACGKVGTIEYLPTRKLLSGKETVLQPLVSVVDATMQCALGSFRLKLRLFLP